jgi:hypothetical protein
MAQQKQDRGQGGRIFRFVLPFVVAVATGVIVSLASSRAPVIDGNRIVDPGQQQLVNAVLAGLAALMITVILVRVLGPRPRRSRRT